MSALPSDRLDQPGPHRDAGLQAREVSAFRGERLVLRGVSFTVAPGGALLLLGANGSGKSTLLRVLAGLKRPDAGQVLWQGADADPLPSPTSGTKTPLSPA